MGGSTIREAAFSRNPPVGAAAWGDSPRDVGLCRRFVNQSIVRGVKGLREHCGGHVEAVGLLLFESSEGDNR